MIKDSSWKRQKDPVWAAWLQMKDWYDYISRWQTYEFEKRTSPADVKKIQHHPTGEDPKKTSKTIGRTQNDRLLESFTWTKTNPKSLCKFTQFQSCAKIDRQNFDEMNPSRMLVASLCLRLQARLPVASYCFRPYAQLLVAYCFIQSSVLGSLPWLFLFRVLASCTWQFFFFCLFFEIFLF